MQPKYPKLLVDPLDPKSTLGGPLVLRWYRDGAYRRWEEAKALTSHWKLSQKLAQKASDWMKAHGITAYVEFRAAGFRSEEAARASFENFLSGRREGVEPHLPGEESGRSAIELRAGKTLSILPAKGNTPE